MTSRAPFVVIIVALSYWRPDARRSPRASKDRPVRSPGMRPI